ncbi:MAG TPA: deoxyribodipyrimidine photo-lyase [Thiomicrospira sp.]|jgi:deoxyribodipyrimidine photo-lyase|nr:deoxyribodipyrimidine photo-lyase [Thiomicrospira sp.]
MNTLVWIQREFRTTALPALQAALSEAEKSSGKVMVAYFHDENQVIGEANNVWLSYSLLQLKADFTALGGQLCMVEGEFSSMLNQVIADYQISKVVYSFQVGTPFEQMQQQALEVCKHKKVVLQPFYSEFLVPAGEFLNKQHKPYLVFTPFYNALMKQSHLIQPIEESVGDIGLTLKLKLKDKHQTWLSLPMNLQNLIALPWAKKIMQSTQVGEQQAWHKLQQFLKDDLETYQTDRDFPSLLATSGLSPYLNFGQINSSVIYYYLQSLMEEGHLKSEYVMPWLRQLVWKEFARHLLMHFPDTENAPFQAKYQSMHWQMDEQIIQAWQQGKTGIPIIDAGMRELWQTGNMHNRVRMLVASFLTKNLNQHWLAGKSWFDNTLFDADPANNVMGWQWVAGFGVDAAPYYRLFNPVTQSVKFDGKGEYLRQWLPELKHLSNKAIHNPWEYTEECRLKSIELGKDYPQPLVDLKQSRAQHLERVALMKTAS